MWFWLWFEREKDFFQTMDSGYTILDFQYQNQIYSVLVAKELASYEECIGFEFLVWSYDAEVKIR